MICSLSDHVLFLVFKLVAAWRRSSHPLHSVSASATPTTHAPKRLGRAQSAGLCVGSPRRELALQEQGAVAITPAGKLRLGDGESMRQMVIAGAGIARLARFHVDADIEARRLVPLLESCNPGDTEEIRAVFIEPGKQVPARVRALLDFLAEGVHISVT